MPSQNSVFNETLRHFPPTVEIPKSSAEDTVFTLTNAAGEKRSLAVPRGTYIAVCPTGLHNNRKRYSNPSCSLGVACADELTDSALLGQPGGVQAREIPRQLPARRVSAVQRRPARMHRPRVRVHSISPVYLLLSADTLALQIFRDRGDRGADGDRVQVQGRGARGGALRGGNVRAAQSATAEKPT